MLPAGSKRDSIPVQCHLGKEVQLKHHAPVISITVLDAQVRFKSGSWPEIGCRTVTPCMYNFNWLTLAHFLHLICPLNSSTHYPPHSWSKIIVQNPRICQDITRWVYSRIGPFIVFLFFTFQAAPTLTFLYPSPFELLSGPHLFRGAIQNLHAAFT